MGELEIIGMHSETVEFDVVPNDESQGRPALVVAAERYEHAASVLHSIESAREQALADAREAVNLLGSDPYNLLGGPQPRARKPRASGGARVTAEQIVAALPATAPELAEKLGTSINNVNGHLSRLQKREAVVKGEGRPAVYHQATSTVYESQEDDEQGM